LLLLLLLFYGLLTHERRLKFELPLVYGSTRSRDGLGYRYVRLPSLVTYSTVGTINGKWGGHGLQDGILLFENSTLKKSLRQFYFVKAGFRWKNCLIRQYF
jgi:hypothetical protein